MKLRHLVVLCCALALSGTDARAGTSIGVSINIGDAPPPPVIVVREEPKLVYVREAKLWMVHDDRWDDDCIRVGGSWYILHSGWWYRASSWRGPYRAVETRRVPAAVAMVPADRWKRHPHGGPPGLRAKEAGRGQHPVAAKGRGRGSKKR